MIDAFALTVRAVHARAVDVALARPVETSGGAMTTTPLVLIDLETEEDVTGRSYVRCYTPLALEPLAGLVTNLGTTLAGHSGTPAEFAGKLERHFGLLGRQGLAAIAMAGIDMALWDACAAVTGVPLVTLLGGDAKPVPAYATLRSMLPQAAAAEAEEAIALGFTAVKLKVGGGDLQADLQAIRAVRAAAGDTVKLMVDYNQSLSVPDALVRAAALDAENLHWIEEPTRADDYDGHARIAAAARTPIQLGENWWGPHDMEKSLAAGASDHVVLDAMKLGGIGGWLRAAALAEAAGLPASSHSFPEVSAHLLAVTPTAHLLEYLDHAAPILVEPIRVEDGHALIPSRPGTGLEWDEEAVARYLVVHV